MSEMASKFEQMHPHQGSGRTRAHINQLRKRMWFQEPQSTERHPEEIAVRAMDGMGRWVHVGQGFYELADKEGRP